MPRYFSIQEINAEFQIKISNPTTFERFVKSNPKGFECYKRISDWTLEIHWNGYQCFFSGFYIQCSSDKSLANTVSITPERIPNQGLWLMFANARSFKNCRLQTVLKEFWKIYLMEVQHLWWRLAKRKIFFTTISVVF